MILASVLIIKYYKSNPKKKKKKKKKTKIEQIEVVHHISQLPN